MSDVFQKYRAESRAVGETDDCAVIAVGIVAGVSYAEALCALARHGREPRGGAWWERTTVPALRELGLEVHEVPVQLIVEQLALRHNYHVKNLTTRQLTKFPGLLGSDRVLVGLFGHLAAYVDGTLHDWTGERAKRVTRLHVVRPIGE